MEAQCIQEQMVFQQLGRRGVIGRFDGGQISSDAGGLLLREVEKHFGIIKRFSGCFRDYRDPQRIDDAIRLDHVTFAYPGTTRAVLDDVSLTLPAGSVVASASAAKSSSGSKSRARISARPAARPSAPSAPRRGSSRG